MPKGAGTRGEGRFAFLLLLPAVVVVFGVVLYPVVRTLVVSLFDVAHPASRVSSPSSPRGRRTMIMIR